MKISKEVKIGISALIVLILMYWGINFLKGLSVFESKKDYYMTVEDATGITISSAVTVQGIKIGSVSNIEMTALNSPIKITLILSGDYGIPNDSYLTLSEGSIMSAAVLRLIPGTSNKMTENGGAIRYVYEPGLMQSMSEIVSKMTGVLTEVEILMANVNKIMTDSTINNVSSTLKNINKLSGDASSIISTQKNRIGRILENFESMSKTFNEATPEFNEAINNLNIISRDVKSSLPNMLTNIDSIIIKLKSPDGTFGKLMNNDELYSDLDSALVNMSLLIDDIKLNPKKYINVTVFEKLSPREKENHRLEKIQIKKERKALK